MKKGHVGGLIGRTPLFRHLSEAMQASLKARTDSLDESGRLENLAVGVIIDTENEREETYGGSAVGFFGLILGSVQQLRRYLWSLDDPEARKYATVFLRTLEKVWEEGDADGALREALEECGRATARKPAGAAPDLHEENLPEDLRDLFVYLDSETRASDFSGLVAVCAADEATGNGFECRFGGGAWEACSCALAFADHLREYVRGRECEDWMEENFLKCARNAWGDKPVWPMVNRMNAAFPDLDADTESPGDAEDSWAADVEHEFRNLVGFLDMARRQGEDANVLLARSVPGDNRVFTRAIGDPRINYYAILGLVGCLGEQLRQDPEVLSLYERLPDAVEEMLQRGLTDGVKGFARAATVDFLNDDGAWEYELRISDGQGPQAEDWEESPWSSNEGASGVMRFDTGAVRRRPS